MDTKGQIEKLKESILSGLNSERQKCVDQLIELEGMKSMDFFQSIFLKDPFHKEKGTPQLHNAAGYGVKRLMELRAHESKSDFKFCPSCASELSEYGIIDPFMTGFRCAKDHYFHIEVKQGEYGDKNLHSDKSRSIDIARDWLTNPVLRKECQNQVAEILRKYIDLNESGKTTDEQDHPNAFCPVCSSALHEFEQDDVWVKGLKCSNSHIFYERNGLSYKSSQLKPDITKRTFDLLLKGYLEKELRAYLPKQIVKLLEEINEEKKNYS